MKKNFKNVLMVGSMMLAMSGAVALTSCKSENKKADEADKATTEQKADNSDSLSGLDSLFGGALKGFYDVCGTTCDSYDADDDDMELVDFDTVIDDEDGTEIPVAYFKYQGELFEMMDIDGDGLFDIAAFDADGDGDISEEEIVDVTEQGITIDDIAEMAGVDTDDDDDCSDGSCSVDDDDDYDDDDSYTTTTSRRSNGPSRQRREEAAEQDLPDYVNNARVKALRKK